MRKWVLAALAAALFVTGCSGGGGNSPLVAKEAEPEGSPSPSSAQEGAPGEANPAQTDEDSWPEETDDTQDEAEGEPDGAGETGAEAEAEPDAIPEESSAPDTDSGGRVKGQSGNVGSGESYAEFNRDGGDLLVELAVDLDLDGRSEHVIAFGSAGSGNGDAAYITEVYVVGEAGGQPAQLGGNLAMGGYGVFEVKLVKMQGQEKNYICLGLSNGANLYGVKLIELKDGEPIVLLNSASPTGVGEDSLTDADNDGVYDGYVQRRYSYDVMYYPVSRFYDWDNGSFSPSVMQIGLDEYPDSVKGVVLQYLTLKELDPDGLSPEGTGRLAELCPDGPTAELSLEEYGLGSWLYSTYLEMDDGLSFDIREMKKMAVAVVSSPEGADSPIALEFSLSDQEGRWGIDRIVEL